MWKPFSFFLPIYGAVQDLRFVCLFVLLWHETEVAKLKAPQRNIPKTICTLWPY